MWIDIIEVLAKGLTLVLVLSGCAAYMTLCERVLMARMQLRLGPNRTGPFGLFQPMADGIKLIFKERFQPAGADTLTYWLAPAIAAFIAFFAFGLIPFGPSFEFMGREINLYIADVNSGILVILAFTSLAVYDVVLAGWSSNNRYSILGSIRGTAQMISYEIPLGLSILSVVLAAGTLNLPGIVEAQAERWFIWTHPIAFIIFVICSFAETNRAPFDLPEAEHELVAGYHTEYGGLKFGMFFMAEYINILLVSAIAITFFLGGWRGPGDLPVVWFAAKLAVFVFFFMWVRATLPRVRYDQLMTFGWKILTPIAIANLIVTAYFVLV